MILAGELFFSFSPINISAHCFLASRVSEEKSAHCLTEDFFYVKNHFSLVAFKNLYLALALTV